MGNQAHMESHRPVRLVAPAHNVHVKCPICSANESDDVESHLLCSKELMDSQGIVDEGKCVRFCLTIEGDACLWYESITPVGNDWISL